MLRDFKASQKSLPGQKGMKTSKNLKPVEPWNRSSPLPSSKQNLDVFSIKTVSKEHTGHKSDLIRMENMAEAKDPTVTDILLRDNRSLDSYSPIFYWIGWIAVAYLIIYVLAVYVGPALFGTGPNYPFYYGRNLRTRRHLDEHGMRLVAKVLPALDKKH